MADYDRGAYTPQTDAPLAFDPRRPSERRPMPMALIGSAVVLVVLLAGVAMVYRSGVRHAGEAPRPVGEPVMSVKSAPTPEAETGKPPANLDVYNENTAAIPAAPTPPAQSAAATTAPPPSGAAPAFTSPPEQPASRPAPKPSTLAMLSKPPPVQAARQTPAERVAAMPVTAAPLKPAAPATAKPAPALDQSEVAAAGMTRASATTVAANDEAPPAPARAAAAAAHKSEAKPVAAPVTAAAASTDPTGSVVQIGAFSSDALAHKGYADVATAMGGQMGGKVRHIQPLQRDGKTLFRTWVSGFASHADARAFCDALKAKGKTCITKG